MIYPSKDNANPSIKYEVAKASVCSIARTACSAKEAEFEYPLQLLLFRTKNPGKFETLTASERLEPWHGRHSSRFLRSIRSYVRQTRRRNWRTTAIKTTPRQSNANWTLLLIWTFGAIKPGILWAVQFELTDWIQSILTTILDVPIPEQLCSVSNRSNSFSDWTSIAGWNERFSPRLCWIIEF